MSNIEEQELRMNFISTDKTLARDSYGEYFKVGEVVEHEDDTVGSATILSFEIDEEYNEVKVITDKGWAHLDFLVKLD